LGDGVDHANLGHGHALSGGKVDRVTPSPLLNLDAGEREDESEELWSLFDLLAVACGGHAGDEGTMDRVVGFCARAGIAVGAHPSYPDREGFGRRSMAPTIAPDAIADAIRAQCAALEEVAQRHGVTVRAVKPHGALYHDAAGDQTIADAVLRGALDVFGRDVTVIGPPRGELRALAEGDGLRYAREGFADRRMRADGSLVPRGEPDALITDPRAAAAQARALKDVEAICVHADTPNAIAIARAVREALRG